MALHEKWEMVRRSVAVLRFRHSWIFASVLLAAVGGCAGYRFGNQTLYRTDLRTVHVPIFASDSLRLDLGELLTEAVVKEIELQTPYKVVADPLADSVLIGRILSETKRILSENINDEPRNLIHTTVVHFTWIDNRGQILAKSVLSLGSDFVPEAGQSITTAQQTGVRKLAKQIVSQMEVVNW